MSWERTTLGDICTVVGGATPKTGRDEYWGGDIPWVTPKDLSDLDGAHEIGSTPRRLTAAGLRSCAASVLPPGSVLLSSRAPIGHVAINTVPMATNQGFKSLIPDRDRVDAKFLFWWLRRNRPMLQSLGTGATFKEISKKTTAAIPIALPPIHEQRHIADLLDAGDALRARCLRALEFFDRLAKATFMTMFDVTSTRSGILSGTHPMGTIEDLATIRSGYGFPHVFQGRTAGDFPFAKVGDISSLARTGRRTLTTAPNFVDSADLLTLKAKAFPAGTVAFAKIGEAIRQNFRVVTDREVLLDNNVMGLVPRESTNSAYLFSVMAALDLYPLAKSTTVPSIRKSELAKVPVPVPDERAQAAFAEVDGAVQVRRATAERSAAASSRLFASLQQRAFAGAL